MFKISFSAGVILVSGLVGLSPAQASTFAIYDPIAGATNISLTGLTLSASSGVNFQYEVPALMGLGVLSSTMTLSATETGAVAFGPIALGSFDGTFAITYAGPTVTAGGVTVTTGQTLLDGSFLGSVFSGYGSTGSLQDSVAAGGLVTFNNNALLTFSPIADQGLSLSLTGINPVVTVSAGKLSPFDAVSQGQFTASVTAVPEPGRWALMLVGAGVIGGVARRRGTATASMA